jgi:hypothetical protein
MRSRDMMVKLDRLPTTEDEVKVPDLSLLSPEDQDRADVLLDRISRWEDIEAEGVAEEVQEFEDLISELPLLGDGDPQQGPTIKVPHALEFYWRWRQSASNWRSYNFHNLSKVQTLRFVELCTEYGYEEGRKVGDHMTPLSQWQADDQAEMRGLIEIVAVSGANARRAEG